MRAPSVIAAAPAVAALVAACSAGPDRQTAPTPGPKMDRGFGHVHGVDLNPADGLVYAATHHGVFRLGPEGPERIADRYQDTMDFTIAKPDRLLASGHPDPREPGPVHLGFIVSEDRAETWTTLALRGEAGFHAISAAGATVYGFDSTDGVVMRSDDGGRTWHTGAQLAVADLAVDPGDPCRVLVTTQEGLSASTDGGLTFAALDIQPPQPLALIDHVEGSGGPRALIGVDAAGGVWASGDGGWVRTGALPGEPHAFTVVGPTRHLAATEQGVLESDDAGRSWRLIAPAAI